MSVEMHVGEMFARGAACQLYMVLKRLTRDCMATDFNEHWESFTDAEEVLKDYKVSFDIHPPTERKHDE